MSTSLWVAVVVAVTVLLLGAMAAATIVLANNEGPGAILRPPKKAPRTPQETVLEGFGARLAAVEVTVQSLPSLWAEERERAKKHGDRAQQAVRDLEARIQRESGQPDPLLDDDADGSGPQLMLPVQEGVGGPDDTLQARANEALAIFGRR